MTDAPTKPKPPRGGRKGGTRFPRYSLKDALPWAKKLVSKTHLGAEAQDVIFAGVVGSAGTTGQIKVSALKQYSLLEGSIKGYSATQLARSVSSAPNEDLPPLLQQAALAPDVFAGLFRTFHGDEVSIARLKQRAAELKVHPDETERCVALYVETLEMAGLATRNGESVLHKSNQDAPNGASPTSDNNLAEDVEEGEETASDGEQENNKYHDSGASEDGIRPRAIFNVNINLDSSLDTEKLERQLKLLRSYGAI